MYNVYSTKFFYYWNNFLSYIKSRCFFQFVDIIILIGCWFHNTKVWRTSGAILRMRGGVFKQETVIESTTATTSTTAPIEKNIQSQLLQRLRLYTDADYISYRMWCGTKTEATAAAAANEQEFLHQRSEE